MAGSPRVWVGKGDRPCLLVVDCPGCTRPAFVSDPDGSPSVACKFCGVTGGTVPPEALAEWAHHKTVCKCAAKAAKDAQ